MIRYSAEKKAEALQSMKDIGAAKTSEAMGISIQTLYKWRNETQDPENTAKKGRSKAAVIGVPVALSDDVKALLNDDELLAKIEQLETENTTLREAVSKLKKALAAFIN